MKFYFRSCQKPRKGRPGHSHLVTSYQERSRCQNKLRGLHCADLIHFIFLYSATAKLRTKLCETADVTSNLGSDCELLEFIECESPTSEVFRQSPSFSNVLNLVFRPFGQVRNTALTSLMMMTRMEEMMTAAVMTNSLAMVMT